MGALVVSQSEQDGRSSPSACHLLEAGFHERQSAQAGRSSPVALFVGPSAGAGGSISAAEREGGRGGSSSPLAVSAKQIEKLRQNAEKALRASGAVKSECYQIVLQSDTQHTQQIRTRGSRRALFRFAFSTHHD